jgi:hypothetical protein
VIVDYHTHSSASDGALPPAVLLAAARDAGVARFALTDHDTIAGFLAIRDSVPDGMILHSGVELSCVWGGVTIHVVGLGFDADAAALLDLLQRLKEARETRALRISERLARKGMPGGLDGARLEAGASQVGRPHFAQWMVKRGYVSSVNKAFDKYLGQGKLGDVKAFWPTLDEVVSAIVASRGTAILAHPLKYKLTRTKLYALAKAFKDAGGTTVELVNGTQPPEATGVLARLAREYDFTVSVGSDFHREGYYGAKLGVPLSDIGHGLTLWENIE